MNDTEPHGDPIWRYLILVVCTALLLTLLRDPQYRCRLRAVPAQLYYVLREELIDRPARREQERWQAQEDDERLARGQAARNAARTAVARPSR